MKRRKVIPTDVSITLSQLNTNEKSQDGGIPTEISNRIDTNTIFLNDNDDDHEDGRNILKGWW